MIRLIILIVPLILAVLLQYLMCLLYYIVKRFNEEKADRLAFSTIKVVSILACFFAGVRLDKKGMENLDKEGPVLYVSNHRSIFDILIFFTLIKKPAGFIGKKELEKVPILSRWMKISHCLFLDRENVREGLKTILKGVEELKAGRSMFIFPEGTRNKDKDLSSLLEFHGGSFKLAERAQVPIVPLVFYNTSAIFEDHKPFLKSQEVKVSVLEPVHLDELSKDQKKFLSQYVQGLMQEELNSLCSSSVKK